MIDWVGGDVLVVCGLKSEGRIVAGPGVRVVAGGGRSEVLAARIEAALDGDIAGLVSFGVAGGLAASMKPGALVVAEMVITSGEAVFSDERWSGAWRARWPGATSGAIAGSDTIVTTVADKVRLARDSGAVATDMESHLVARAALRHGLPFVVIRAIADPSDRALPPAAAVALRGDGGLALGAIARSIAAAPGQLPALLALGLDSRAAMRTLRRVRQEVGGRLAFTAT